MNNVLHFPHREFERIHRRPQKTDKNIGLVMIETNAYSHEGIESGDTLVVELTSDNIIAGDLVVAELPDGKTVVRRYDCRDEIRVIGSVIELNRRLALAS